MDLCCVQTFISLLIVSIFISFRFGAIKCILFAPGPFVSLYSHSFNVLSVAIDFHFLLAAIDCNQFNLDEMCNFVRLLDKCRDKFRLVIRWLDVVLTLFFSPLSWFSTGSSVVFDFSCLYSENYAQQISIKWWFHITCSLIYSFISSIWLEIQLNDFRSYRFLRLMFACRLIHGNQHSK